MKKHNIVFLSVLSVIFLFALFLSFFGHVYPSKVELKECNNKINSLHVDPSLFIPQTFNNCGPYAATAAINILYGELNNPETLAKETKYRIIKNLTLPQGVVKLLHDHNVKTKQYILKHKNMEEKVIFLKNQIDMGHPVILLLKIGEVLHYVTVLGYNEKGFMIFDSAMPERKDNPSRTVIDKECSEGNCFSSFYYLTHLWSDGGVGPFFNSYAIVCSKK